MQKITAFISSRKFFYIIVGVFVFQALWIALSAAYPMAFDEDFHLGIIRLYAHHISPFWSGQPPNADMYGAVFRDPSYLYHWLMSFPYRLISVFTHNQTTIVLWLRFINIGLFAAALPLYRRLLLKTGAGYFLTHMVMFLFVLLPVVPFMAGQINYDNALLPLTALSLLLTLSISDELRLYKRFNAQNFLLLASLLLLTCIVKYTFLPIAAAIVLFLGGMSYYFLGRKRKFWRSFVFGLTLIEKRLRLVLVIGVIVSAGLFSERYVLNAVRYHVLIVPNCSQILPAKNCSAYGPWIRDEISAANKPAKLDSPLGYADDWLYGIWLRTYFTLGGPAVNFETRGPLRLPATSAAVLLSGGFVLSLWKVKAIWRKYDRPAMVLMLLSSLLYIFALLASNYKSYLHAGKPVAINGRYFLVIAMPLVLLIGLGFHEAFGKLPWLRNTIAGAAVVCFLLGGGVITFIVRSNDTWLWPSPAVRHINYDARQWLSPVMPGAAQPTLFLR